MSDPATHLIMQNELLREIREELRGGRATFGSASDAAMRPSMGNAVRQQAFMDRLTSNDFAARNFALPYSHLYQSTLIGDIAGATGFGRAPVNFTQAQFEQISAENIGIRMSTAATSLFAPAYTSRVNELGADIFSQSHRFARFGETGSLLGAGFNRSSALQLARQIQSAATTDMRLTQRDYSTVVSAGMAGGQFDDIRGSTDAFMSRMRELADATATLTRTLNTGVQEVSQAMSGLRMAGVTDVQQQTRMLTGIGAAARVAGITTSEMLGVAQASIAQGMQFGVGPQTSVNLAASNVALARQLLPSGIMSAQRIAAGGGALGIAQDITGFQQQLLGQDASFLATLGRGAGVSDILGATVGGAGMIAAGGIFGMAEAQMRRSDVMRGVSARDADTLLQQRLRFTMDTLGVGGASDPRAQSLAYSQLRSMGMGDEAAFAYARLNFSEEGRSVRDRTRVREFMAEQDLSRQEEADRIHSRYSLGGRFRSGLAGVSRWGAGALDWTANTFTTGQTGFMGMGGQLDITARQLESGLDTTANVFTGFGAPTPTTNSSPLRIGLRDRPGGGAVGSGLLGAGIGAGAALTLGLLALGTGPVGWVMGGLAAASVGAGGFSLGAGIHGLAMGEETLTGQAATNYMAGLQASRRPADSNRVQQLLRDPTKVNQSNSLRQFLALDLTDPDRATSMQASRLAAAAANELGDGTTVQDIFGLRQYGGLETNMLEARTLQGFSGFDVAAFRTSYGKLINEAAENTRLDFRSGDTMGALRRYLTATDTAGRLAAGNELASRGATGNELRALSRNYNRMSAAERSAFIQQSAAGEAMGGNAAINRALRGALSFASGEVMSDSARTELDRIRESGNYLGLVDALTDPANALGRELREAGGVFAQAANIASATDIRAMTRRDFESTFGPMMGASQVKEAFATIQSDDTDATANEFRRRAIAATLSQAVDSSTPEAQMVNVLRDAINTLERINTSLSKQTP